MSVSPDALAAYFGRAVEVSSVSVEPLNYGVMNPVTQGLHRVSGVTSAGSFSMIRKTIGLDPVDGPSVSFEMSDEPTHWNYWRREALAYSSGLAASFGAPSCFFVEEDSRSAVLWLDEVTSPPALDWSVARLALAARHLGGWQAHVSADFPWLSKDYLRVLLPTRLAAEVALVDNSANWEAPLVRSLLDPSLRARVVSLWKSRGRLLDALDACPQTVNHFDFRVPNLFGSDDATVAIDWQFVGVGALGQDLVSLVADSVFMGYLPPASLESLEEQAFASYVEGLRSEGWKGDESSVWFAYAATSGLRFGLACGWLMLLATQPQHALVQEQRYGRPIAELITDRLVAVSRALDLGEEALGRLG